jgi:site-specific recombinase XerD
MTTPERDQPARCHPLAREMGEFLIDRRARNVTPKTLTWYEQSLCVWAAFLDAHDVTTTGQVTASLLRRFVVHLQSQGRTAGGVRNVFCAVKAFLRWYSEELAPPDWASPLRKVRTPRVPQRQMVPVPVAHVKALLATCRRRSFVGDRDRAMLLALLDTGCRASEFVALDLGDVDLGTGSVLVRQGKGRKPRVTFLGGRARLALARYLRHRKDLAESTALWATVDGTRLTYAGLRQVIRRRAKRAEVETPSLHSFRHAFALNALRAGVDVISLQRLLGHADLSMLRRYLAQTTEDLAEAHHRGSPVDRLRL